MSSLTKVETLKPERLASIMGASTCALAGILLGLSIGASLYQWNFINGGPGGLFTGAYGAFAFIIPLYLFGAAWLLIDPVFRPGRIFILSSTIIPFLTLSFGFSYIRDFEAMSKESLVLASLGVSGFSFIIISTVVVECLGILVLHTILFGKNNAIITTTKDSKNDNKSLAVIETGTVNAKTPEKEETNTPLFNFDFPDWQPLRSLEVYREIHEGNEQNTPEQEVSFQAEIDSDDLSSEDIALTEIQDDIEELPGIEYKEPDALVILNAQAFTPYARVTRNLNARTTPSHTNMKYQVLDEEDIFITEEDTLTDESQASIHVSMMEDEYANETSVPVVEEEYENKAQVEFTPTYSFKPDALKKKPHNHSSYFVPVDGILNQYPDGQYWIIDDDSRRAAVILQDTLSEFGIQAEVTGIKKGPVITMFEILPAPGVKLSKIVNLQDNIALRLAASSVRIVAPIPGKHAVGIEVPNKKRSIVSFREIIEGELANLGPHGKHESRKHEIPVVLGKDITGDAITVDLCQMPHLLIAGSTGSGKSVCVNSMILSILYQLSPAQCRLIMIDPKIVELKLYNDIPHLLTPVITEPKRAFQALQYCIFEMERRYACLDSMGVRDIKAYNRRIKERKIAAEHIPYIVVIIDEFADLMATTGKELESTVARLAAMSRAVGIHLVLATQRPSIDVITGLIKANIPSRIAFMVASKMDSRIIIDMVGAEKLLGKGDMLYSGVSDPFPIRMQGAFISEEEVERVVEYVKTLGEPEYIDDEIFYDEEEDSGPSLFTEGDDPLYDKALEVVMQQGKASASYIQRRLKIGYNRAARLVEEMEHRGVVGPAQGSRPRELLRSA